VHLEVKYEGKADACLKEESSKPNRSQKKKRKITPHVQKK